ncbi:MAG: TIGR03118 family protein [FCB group bacterium]|jgi:uncharacterized protein (TIGR03118 family)
MFKYLINISKTLPFLFAVILLLQTGCNKNSTSPTMSAFTIYYLVSDTSAYQGARIDASLINAWGIDISATGVFWLSSNHGSVSTVYDVNGLMKIAPVAIPSATMPSGGAPSGLVYNSTNDFMDAVTGTKAKWIFASEDGIIAAWASGASADRLADQSASGAVYKGIALGAVGTNNYLYLADFKGKKVDVFDKNFGIQSTFTFKDPGMPADFGPFNIKNINGQLYIAYAKPKAPEFMDDESGPGNGYVDIFNTDGTFVKRFITQGKLNSPWGIVMAPSSFGSFSNAILVGNFGDGAINAYEANGNYLGQIADQSGNAIKIAGLWGLFFITDSSIGDVSRLYFTAGPYEENHGLFGYIK